MVVQDVIHAFTRYVYNDMPAHLLYLPQRKIVGREELKEIFWKEMESITEDEVEDRNCSRKSKIDLMVWEKVPYAMFSHRWLDKGEPTFQDMSASAQPAELPGYSKLFKFCEKAQEYGCQLAWSDTCCIDKTSSAELEEAIRSMFRWYRNSRICIAYLAESRTLGEFDSEVWFRRGWTLQELLAPRRMKFYGKGWVPFGASHNDKEDKEILHTLAEVTKIPRQGLTFFLPGTRAIREKMLWASTRETTRIEDTAYSLLGIFEITMSIAYGEGAWAFHRLMETIIQRCDEWTILAWAGPSSWYNKSIPRSPHGYRTLDPEVEPIATAVQRRSTKMPHLSFEMTQRGLKLKVLVVELEDIRNGDEPNNIEADDEYWYPPLQSRDQNIILHKVAAHSNTSIASPKQVSWAVGILNYQHVNKPSFWRGVDREEGILKAKQDFVGFLLRKSEHSGQFKNSSWVKIDTEKVVIIHCKSSIQKRLKTVWL